MTPSEFTERVNAYCAWSRGTQTSGWRSPERNAQVGGHSHSYHMVGLAADVVYGPNPTPPKAQATRRARQLGLRLVREGSHDHLQPLGE